jgi:RNA polymerase sigma factor (TIGR02999 family)
MQHERLSHTLQSGALVNELYMRLADWEGADWQNRAHFFGMCARIMRQILVDHARSRCYQKRGGAAQKISLSAANVAADFKDPELLAVDEALSRFADLYPRQNQVVELRFFGGLSVEETAAALNVSHPTVIRDWKFARAWLMSSLNGQPNV